MWFEQGLLFGHELQFSESFFARLPLIPALPNRVRVKRGAVQSAPRCLNEAS